MSKARTAGENVANARQLALVRPVSASIGACQLTHLSRSNIDLARARSQHAAYVTALTDLGLSVRELKALPEQPDAVFVEDTALVLDELALITRPGAAVRREECASVSQALAEYRKLQTIEAPGTLDGGDILCADKDIFVGLSTRSNRAGIEQLAHWTSPFGYRVHAIEVKDCLHLKSAVSYLGDRTLLIDPDWIGEAAFESFRCLQRAPGEPGAANVLRVASTLLCSQSFPATEQRLLQAGYRVRSVPSDELAKAEGALTCCSLIINMPAT